MPNTGRLYIHFVLRPPLSCDCVFILYHTVVSCAITSSFPIKMSKRFSTADVAAHKTADDLYIIVDEDVYDLTKFADEHPGGKKSMISQSRG
jgi:cytochrome b involved in lipid metabolism